MNSRNGKRPRIDHRALMLLCLASMLVGCEKPKAKAPEISVVRVARAEEAGDRRTDREASYLAIVKFDHETDLSFKVGGILVSAGPAAGTDWDEGTPVKAGAVLAELKQADFTNALISARAHAELTAKVLERFRKLRLTDAISQQELDVTEADWRSAQAQLDQAEQNLRDSRLVATKDGVVLNRYVNSRVTVAPGQRVLRFADTSMMSVELGLPDRLVGRLSPGKEVDVEMSALEDLPPFRGRVTEVGVAASNDGRLFRVVIKVPNPHGLLRSGMTARINLGEAPDIAHGTVCVPLSALVTMSPESPLGSQAAPVGTNNTSAALNNSTRLGVFVVQQNRAVKRAVVTGDILSSSILVTQGLRPGEEVVTAGASFLYDGAPVQVASDALASN